MTDSLRAKLVDTCSGVAALKLSEAEQDTYPYVVYDMTTEPRRTKDGVYAFFGDGTRIRIVGKDLAALEQIRVGLEAAIQSGMNDGTFISRLEDTTKECVSGEWTIELTYTLRQFGDWVRNN